MSRHVEQPLLVIIGVSYSGIDNAPPAEGRDRLLNIAPRRPYLKRETGRGRLGKCHTEGDSIKVRFSDGQRPVFHSAEGFECP